MRCSLLRLPGLWAPAGPLGPGTIPCLGLGSAGHAGVDRQGFLRFPSVATLTTGAGALLPKIVPGRKEVARLIAGVSKNVKSVQELESYCGRIGRIEK